jgi:hypothetical protein
MMEQDQNTAKKISTILNQGLSLLKPDTLDSLVAARTRAVQAMPAEAAQPEPVFAAMGLFAHHRHGQRFWFSMAAVLSAILAVVILMQFPQSREPVGDDASLLGSDLPPEAYLDKGFDAWLEQSSRH